MIVRGAFVELSLTEVVVVVELIELVVGVTEPVIASSRLVGSSAGEAFVPGGNLTCGCESPASSAFGTPFGLLLMFVAGSTVMGDADPDPTGFGGDTGLCDDFWLWRVGVTLAELAGVELGRPLTTEPAIFDEDVSDG